MNTPTNPQPLILTNKAQCRDCYRCLRVCPVKAIRMKDGQASIEERLCLGCGTCIRNCPQQAKHYRRDLDAVKALLSGGGKVAVTVAPSLAAAFPGWKADRLAAALRRLGFRYVAETAYGAWYSAQLTRDYIRKHQDKSCIISACPAVVAFVEKFNPESASLLAPVPSPMIWHGQQLKNQLGGDWKVVFIGPCVAKKTEARRPEYAGLIDAVLTFEELQEWFTQETIDLRSCEESAFDQVAPDRGRHYPLPGGALHTANFSTGLLCDHCLAVSGYDDIQSALQTAAQSGRATIIEPLFCRGGCVDGPAMGVSDNIFNRRDHILNYAVRHEHGLAPESSTLVVRNPEFGAGSLPIVSAITEEQIRAVLEQTGKARLEDQLNCGACGYGSCREKALAVIRGMAENEMCIPFMRRQAERRTDKIIETSPNGIIILDHELKVISMNPSFRAMFMCSQAFLGRRIAEIIDSEPFERLTAGEDLIEMVQKYDSYHLICQQIMYALRAEQQYVGIFVNITSSLANQKKLDSLRSQTLMQANDLLRHQIDMARQIASFLGESTARGEQLVENLMKLTEDDAKPSERKSTLWDIYTSK